MAHRCSPALAVLVGRLSVVPCRHSLGEREAEGGRIVKEELAAFLTFPELDFEEECEVATGSQDGEALLHEFKCEGVRRV